MNKHLIIWSVTVALGGLLFGMDVANISGAEQRIQTLWNLSDIMHGTVVAIALYGTILGAAFGSIPANRYGRKKTLIAIGIIFLVSSLGSALAQDVYTFMFFRFLGGISIGASSVVAPVYISEIAPPRHRGKLAISFQLNVVIGILLAYFCNYLLRGTGGENDWRYMLGIVAIPSAFFSLLMFFTPESPRWLLLHKQDKENAAKVLLAGGADPENLTVLINEIMDSGEQLGKKDFLFSRKYWRFLVLAFLMACFNQLSGINAVIYFAPRIFEMGGLGKEAAFLSSAGIGLVNLMFTVFGWYLIDRSGRRSLLFIGSIGYIISLTLMSLAYAGIIRSGLVLFVFLFIAAHAIGQGSVIWVFLSEIFPNTVRAQGASFGCLTHWLFAALISQTFPFFANRFGGSYIFGFFAFMMVLQLLFVWKMMPETKGVSLEKVNLKVLH
ncbi:MAG: sugar porter family MFS transporter [Chitinophagaceae bacterium]|nr:sugar porter family MFS transporter [Chitinophagaceae bacterium]